MHEWTTKPQIHQGNIVYNRPVAIISNLNGGFFAGEFTCEKIDSSYIIMIFLIS